MVKILAIDDRNDNLISLKAIIKDAFPDYVVLMALSGPEGIEIAITENPDVILLDIFMPVMDGFEVCRRLKHDERISDIPVIFLTAAKGDKESRIKALEVGAEAFLTKPIDETEITAQIRAMVKIKAANQIKRYEKARLEELVAERTKKLEQSQIATLNALNDLMAENKAREKTEVALRESEERFIHLFERAPLGYQSLDEDALFIEVNEAWLDTLGYAKEEVIGKWFGDFVAPEFVGTFRERFPIFKEQGFIHSEFEMLHKDGKRRFIAFDGRIGHKQDGSFEKTHCILQDITEQKEVEKNVKLMAHALESISECVTITDTNDILLYVNEAFTRTYGYSENELIGKHIGILRTKDADAGYNTDILNLTIDGGWRGEMINTKKDGTHFPILLSTSVIKDENKKPVALIGVARDISEMRKKNEELLSAKRRAEESDRLKTAFLHNISHEIRTPMNAIVGFAELLNEPDLLPEESKSYSDIIVRSSNQLLSIITDIVNIATIEAGQEKIVERIVNVNSICQLVYGQFQLKAEKQNIELKHINSIADCNSSILTDETKLIQILTNLISNAIKFTKEGSVVFGCELKNDNLEFYVKDSGIGIPPDKQDDIFKRFRQLENTENRQFGGSGLGLSISKTYVELLGGRMWVESEPGKGSSFYFTIPYKEAITLTH